MLDLVRSTVFPAPARWSFQGTFERWMWPDLVVRVAQPELWPGGTTIAAGEERLPGWSFARYRDNARVDLHDEHLAAAETAMRVIDVHGIAVEYVDEPTASSDVLRRWWGAYACVAYTTAYHELPMGEKPAGPRWRVLLPFRRPVSLAAARKVGAWALHPRHGVGIVHPVTEEVWRFWSAPAIAPGKYTWMVNEAEPLDPDAAIAELRTWLDTDRIEQAHGDLADCRLAECAAGLLRRMEEPRRRELVAWPGAPAGTADPGVPAGVLTRRREDVAWRGLAALAGSLWPGRVAVVTGPLGRGRTAFALQVAEAAARAGHPVLHVSAGVGPDEIVARLLSLRSAHDAAPYGAVLQGLAPLDDVRTALRTLQEECPSLYVWTPLASARTPDGLTRRLLAASQAHGTRPPLLVLDGLDDWADGADREARRRQIAVTLRDAVHARSLDPDWPGACALVVCDPAEEPGAELASAASLVLELALDRSAPGPVRDEAVRIVKNRHGAVGAVAVSFHGGAGWFEEPTGSRP